MKNKIILLFFLIPFISKCGTTYTSIVVYGDWSTSTTWSPAGIPTQADNVIISTSVNIKASDPLASCNNITINSGATLLTNAALYIYGSVSNSGILNCGNIVAFVTPGGTILKGTGTFTFGGNTLYIINPTTINDTIAANVTITGNPTVDLYTNKYHVSSTTVNLGKCSITQMINDSPTPLGGKWINGPNSSLTTLANILPNAYDIFDASAAGNTVNYSGTTSYTIKKPLSTYCNLTCSTSAGHILTIPSNLTITGNLLITTGSLDVTASNYNLIIDGNITNNSTTTAFVPRTATVTLGGSAGQTIGGTKSTTFYNLIAPGTGSETVTLGNAETVSNNLTLSAGTLDCQTFQITGNATGIFNMAANTFLLLGTTASATNVAFPTNFTSGNISLNVTSTVKYLANTAQVISVTPTYGNLFIDAGSAVTKTLSGTPLIIAGNLTINTNHPTLSIAANTINLTGNLTNNGTVSFSSGALNILGNLTNNGTYTGGTGTTTMNGSSGQLINGTSAANFYNLTATGNGSETVTLGFSENVLGNLLVSAGTFDVSASNYSLTLGGNLTTNGTLNTRSGLITFNGSSQAIGGTTAISFYDLTVNQTSSAQTVTLNTSESFQDALTMTTGTLAASGANTMTLLSNAARTGRIAQAVSPSNTNITAQFIVQRYLSSRSSTQPNYIGLSSPVQSAQTIKDWNNSNRTLPNKFYMSGIGGPDGNAGSYVSVFLYSETAPNANYGSYVPITHYATPGNTYVVTPGQGIYLWLGTSLSTMSDPFTYISHGVPSIAPVAGISVTVTNSGASNGNGFNLIGNPFCSPIDWATFQAANPSLSTTFALMQGDGSWHHYISGSIPMEQGFGVTESNPSATITFQENHKTTIDAGLKRGIKPLMEPADEPNAITFILSNDVNSFSSPATITFGNNYVKTYDNQNDALFIQSLTQGVPQLSTLSPDGYNLSVYRLPDTEKKLEIPITAIGTVGANHTITIHGLDNITSYQCVNLIDGNGNVLNNFNTTPSYSFYLSQSDNKKNYSLQFVKLSGTEGCNNITNTDISSNIQIIPATNGAFVKFNLPHASDMVISVYNILGQKVMNDITGIGYANVFTVNLKEGQLYIVKVQTASGVVTKKLYR